MLQTVDGEQTRDWLLLTCNVIHNSKINFQILTNTNCLCVFHHSWWLFASPWTVACQAPLSMETGKNTGVGCHLLLWGNLSDRSNLCVLHLLHWQMVFYHWAIRETKTNYIYGKGAITQIPAQELRHHHCGSRSQLKSNKCITFVGKSILLGQGVHPSEIKTLPLKWGPATVPIPRKIPLTSPFQGNSKFNTRTKISDSFKQRKKYRGKL